MKNNIDKLVDDALNSFDGAERAQPAPWLLTRIHARLQKKQQSIWDKISVFISKPSIAIPALAIVLAINIGAVFISGSSKTAATEQVSGDTADDLQYNNGSFYDIVNAPAQ